jgi:HEAT repeat protein
VRWLLRAFKHLEESTRIGLADCFGYLYQEEEAVIHRKYLALPYLIRQLQDDRPTVQAAAARALANAERYRAVQPLLDRLADPSQAVRAEAARALGLIREGKAMSALLDTLQAPGQGPAVYAQALIALKRLDLPGFGAAQRDFVAGTGRFAAVASELRLGAVRFALEHKDDGIVLDQDELARLAEGWAKQALPGLLREDAAPAAAALAEVLALNPPPAGLELLSALARHDHPQPRAVAFAALLRLDPAGRTRRAGTGLADPALAVRLAVLRVLADAAPQAADPPDTALLRALDAPETKLAAIAVLARMGGKETAKRLAALAADPSESAETVVAALEALAARPAIPATLPEAVYAHADARVRAAAFHAWAVREPGSAAAEQVPARFAAAFADGDESVQRAACQALLRRQEAWAAREAESRLAAAKTGAALRACLLERHKVSLASPAGQQLTKAALAKDESGRILWLPSLLDSADPAAEGLAWRLLQDAGEGPRIRMAAAMALAARHGAEVLERLQRR